MIELKQNETIQKKVRKHLFVLLGHIVGLLFIYSLPFALYIVVKGVEIPLGEAQTLIIELNAALVIFIGAAWTLLIWMKFAGTWTDYYLDIWIITNQRVVDIEQHGFFHREISTLRVEQIQDVTIRVHGFIATLFNFGDIHVQTAGESREFTIRGIPDPQGVKEIIMKQHDVALKK